MNRPAQPGAARSGASPAAAADRLAGVAAPVRQLAHAAMQALQQRQGAAAERMLRDALQLSPDHPEVLRLLAVALRLQERNAEALAALEQAAARRPDDALIQNGLGTALEALGNPQRAIAAFRRACELAPQTGELWANLGKSLSEQGEFEAALPVLERTLGLKDHRTSRLRLAYALRVLGRTDEAARCYRDMIARDAADGAAWLGLASLKTRPFAAEDIAAMRAALTRQVGEDDRISLGFALAKAEEDHGEYARAFDTLGTANALTRRIRPWDRAQFSAHVDAVLAAFAAPAAGAPNGQGEDVIFMVSMPRAGSSLTEQILASHPQIEGAGELDDLTSVITAESVRRNAPFPQWVAAATPADWQRLGEEYLARTARWRRPGARFTDKLPGNWLRVGAACAMLPGARVLDCRRDALESSLSCFRQLFMEGAQAFSYDLDDIAAYWHDYDRSMRHWRALFPQRLRTQHYEDLQREPERQVAELLAWLGLPFDPACLDYTGTARSVRTASASQVREPLMRNTARADKFGALLDPLRRALGMAPFGR